MTGPGIPADHSSRFDLGAPIRVGRTNEQRLLREHLAATMDGHGRLVLVGGEAGIGKTTLTRDLIAVTPRPTRARPRRDSGRG